jgi:hypothetical protein
MKEKEWEAKVKRDSEKTQNRKVLPISDQMRAMISLASSCIWDNRLGHL